LSPARAGTSPAAGSLGLVLALLAGGCFRPGAVEGAADAGGQDAASAEPAPAPPPRTPGPEGPFVEPTLEEKPAQLHAVLLGPAGPWPEVAARLVALARLEFVPVGYPAVDQAGGVGPGFELVLGKFARPEWARALQRALETAGVTGTRLEARAYQHDRLVPARNAGPPPRAGLTFSGEPGVPVPLLAAPEAGAAPAGGPLADGAPVLSLEELEAGARLWHRVRTLAGDEGFLPAPRLRVDANVFPAATGRRAVLGIPLGCLAGGCRWDYWLVGPGLAPRRLLKAAGERLPHAFSPDGRLLAYTTAEPVLVVMQAEGEASQVVGPGTSPAWSPDGRRLYLRGPGVRGHRDEVRAVSAADLLVPGGPEPPDVRVVVDLPGEPFYPRALAAVPPPVDTLWDGQLFTLFFRRVEKQDKAELQRWGVLFDAQGRIREKKGVLIGQ
jgi:hypothetical protein